MPADPRRVKELFGAAAAVADRAEREALLARECGDDRDLRQRLDALLNAHDHPKSALERPLAVAASEPDADRTAEHRGRGPGAVGDVIDGRFKLLERIGEGGMGEVWVADQLDPVRRRVALKMIKPGMNSRQVLARFEVERQALALMDHPNVAKVLDAGTTADGRPFFVMELVKGTPITDFCDTRKLSPRDRLELFVPVCRAIQHAHQKGIIHRDIKPGNVLVALHDETPVPKVIDFGVAKAVGQQLTDKTLYTGFGVLVGTPAYMAPEQATFNQLDVDTRADVYALGVLLYELLAGSPPFDPAHLKRAALDEVLRIVREEEPPRPSARLSTSETKATIAATRRSDPRQLAALMRGELDWIVMKALEKDRGRRYDSVAGLANDVERYLNDEPVEACPPTVGYRVRKFARKHRVALTTAAAFAGLLLASAVGGGYLAVQARRAEAVAEDRRQEAEASARAADHNAGLLREAVQTADENRQKAERTAAYLSSAKEQQQLDQYAWDMQLLPLAFEAGHTAEVSRMLARHAPRPDRPDRRGFEWHYWDRQLHADLRTDTLPGVGGGHAVWGVSPDGSRVARLAPPAGEKRGNGLVLQLWDVADRKLILTHRLPPPKPSDDQFGLTPAVPQFSPDGRRVLAGYSLATISRGGGGAGVMPRRRQVLDVGTGRVLLDLDGGEPVARLRGDNGGAFSADGRRFAAVVAGPDAPRGQVRVWDLETGQAVGAAADAHGLAGSALSPDGTRLVSLATARLANGPGLRVSVRDTDRGEEAAGWDVPLPALVLAAACSPDGSRVAGVASGPPAKRATPGLPHVEPQSVTVWEAATGKVLHTLALPRPVGGGTSDVRLFFSPDGSRLAVGRITAAARMGTGGSDLTLWDAGTGRQLPPLLGFADTTAAGSPNGPGFSPDGRLVVATDGNVVRVWDVETGLPVRTLRGHVHPVTLRGFTAGGKRLWSLEATGLLKEWDVRPPGPVAIPVAGAYDSPRLGEFALSADGGRVATLAEARGDQGPVFAVQVWTATGQKANLLVPPRRGPVKSIRELDFLFYRLALSRDGRRVALLRAENVAKLEATTPAPDVTVWDADTGVTLLHQPLAGLVRPSVALSPDGSAVAVAPRSADGEAPPAVRVFEVTDGKERRPIPAVGARAVVGLSFSPDGRRLAALTATGEAGAGTVVVWDAATGGPVSAAVTGAARRFASDPPAALAWSPDGSLYVVAGGTQDAPTVVVHETATGKPLATMDQPLTGTGAAEAICVAFSADGRRVAALQNARGREPPTVRLWDAASGKELLALRTASAALWGTKRLAFTADGSRLVFAEFEADTEGALGGVRLRGVTRPLLLTTWDATPVAARGVKTP